METRPIRPSADWIVWQIADSGFPAGGFTQSWGLEAAWQCGEVTGTDTLRQFLRDSILQAGHAALPLVNAAHARPERIEELDALCDAFLANAVANRASRLQGRAWLSTCARIWASDAVMGLVARARGLRAHHAPIAGALFRALDLPLSTAQRLILYGTSRGVLAAAVRLGIVGTYQAQRLQYECGGDLDVVLDRCGRLGEGDLAQIAPIIDCLQSSHDRLYSRLFQS
jgi:urease accessory protein